MADIISGLMGLPFLARFIIGVTFVLVSFVVFSHFKKNK